MVTRKFMIARKFLTTPSKVTTRRLPAQDIGDRGTRARNQK